MLRVDIRCCYHTCYFAANCYPIDMRDTCLRERPGKQALEEYIETHAPQCWNACDEVFVVADFLYVHQR